MDTKSKSNKGAWAARILSLLVIAGLAAAIIAGGFVLWQDSTAGGPNRYEREGFVRDIHRYSYILDWQLAGQLAQGAGLTPADHYFPFLDELAKAHPEDTDLPEAVEAFKEMFSSWFMDWRDSFLSEWSGLEYLAMDDSGRAFGQFGSSLAELASGGGDDGTYAYYAVLRFGPDGQLTAPQVYGADSDRYTSYSPADFLADSPYGYQLEDYASELVDYFIPPANLQVAFGVSWSAVHSGATFYEDTAHQMGLLNSAGLEVLMGAGVVAAALLGLALAVPRRLGMNRLRLARLPFEASLLLLVIPLFVALDYVWSELFVYTFNQALYRYVLPGNLPADLVMVANYGSLAAVLMVCLGAVFFAAASLWQARTLGLDRYFTEKSLIVRFFIWLFRQLKRLWAWLTAIDLTDRSNKTLLKLLGANFIIMAVLCSIWFVGLPLLLAYTVALFIIAQRYYKRIQAQYATLLAATGEIANGRLDVEIDEDLGVFEPMKAQLAGIQSGFKKAVDAEVKSQAMKTELITNVSHDLKTPLTAIITYVDLLKKEDLSEEERRSYIATLDMKSQRLKRLIEDLFEMSRATSRDISLNLGPVDLPALLRQVAVELQDELDAAGVEFRLAAPPEGVHLTLDGERTSRIFENLVLNITKYSLPGTRAYASVTQNGDAVCVELKNISREPLDFDNEAITDRFVRGDAARSTEGSGLGLAIAKSFAEAQGGSFTITTDGDLFKATVCFPAAPRPQSWLPQPAETAGGAQDAAAAATEAAEASGEADTNAE